MNRTSSMFLALVLVVSLLAASAEAYPSPRQKRVSDQRLAELQTMLAIARLKSRLPVKHGYVDISKIGRKKRSQDYEGRQEKDERMVTDYDAVENSIISAEVDNSVEEAEWARNYFKRLVDKNR